MNKDPIMPRQIEVNVVTEARRLYNKPLNELLIFINECLGTRYMNFDFYAWASGNRRLPGTVERVLRQYVIQCYLKPNQSSALLEAIKPPTINK